MFYVFNLTLAIKSIENKKTVMVSYFFLKMWYMLMICKKDNKNDKYTMLVYIYICK